MSKRSDRIQPVHDLAAAAEQEAGRELAAARRAVQEHEARLAQLHQFRDEYHGQTIPGLGSIDPVRLQNYNVFLERLGEAIRQQQECVSAARAALEQSAATWRGRHLQATALGNAVERLREDEARAAGRREQRDLDEVGRRGGDTGED